MTTVKELLSKLEGALREELLTPAKAIDHDTFFCLTEITLNGIAYHQVPFDSMPENFKTVFKGKEKGEKVFNYKVVAIYHIWGSDGPKIWSTRKI